MGRPLASRQYGLYLHYHQQDAESEPVLLADADTLAEALVWLGHNWLKMVRRMQPMWTFIELFDWQTGVTVHWTRVG